MRQPIPGEFELPSGIVHVWKVPLIFSREHLAKFLATLAVDERERAARFHFEKGRDCYVAARGVLRELLGKYLNTPPDLVRLTYTSHGKPELGPQHASPLRFNLAHSGDLALIAFVTGARVGIDIERARPDFDGQRIADRFFSESESAMLRAAPEAARVRGFTRQWARKESFIKAHGEGLSYPLGAFAIEEDVGGKLTLVVGAMPQKVDLWSVRDLEVDGDYAAALSVELPAPDVHLFNWTSAAGA